MYRRILHQTLRTVTICVFALLCSCSENSSPLEPNTPEPAPPVARMRYSFGGGVYTQPLENVRFSICYLDEPGSPDLGLIEIWDGDEGREIELNPGTSESVMSFFELLNNGTEDSLIQQISWGTGGGSVSRTGSESSYLEDRIESSQGPDLADTPAVRAVVTFEHATVGCPGSDPGGDGLWADLLISVVVSFYAAE